MKRTPIRLCVALLLVVGVSPSVHAEAQPLSDLQIVAIRKGCQVATRGIDIVQEAEAASRVNRGRVYESIMQLVTAFNSRVALNKLDAPVLTSTTVKLQKALDTFHAHYIDYAKTMDQTKAYSCHDAPVSFYDSLTAAREARALVAEDIRTIDRLLDQYQDGLTKLKTDISKPSNGDQD